MRIPIQMCEKRKKGLDYGERKKERDCQLCLLGYIESKSFCQILITCVQGLFLINLLYCNALIILVVIKLNYFE